MIAKKNFPGMVQGVGKSKHVDFISETNQADANAELKKVRQIVINKGNFILKIML